jgi:tRNA pseudouridine38-40 synthase
MPRYAITIEYDGTPFSGWQVQPAAPSVQGAIADALERMTDTRPLVTGAGRTDAGVHATGQVAHFDLAKDWVPDKIRDALNFHLRPNPIAVIEAREVAADFDARRSAISRAYLYRLLVRRAPPVLDRHRVWWLPVPLDAEAMHQAAQGLVGRHDFTTFRAAQCQAKSPIRTLDRLDVSRVGPEVHVVAHARSFLHNQVRSIVGTLKLVGTGRMSAAEVRAALEARDRAACGPVAPPDGLYLTEVGYPPSAQPSSAGISSGS